ncbi:class I SAM-dependent methyltransferase [Flavivirga jejuensis]|uniref:Methyltransferase n=1 Tax=Flavivirga jejuensis TaxID=870487 RepID=A0ABT8WI61_9FLAO|nr:methyltransferase [Flavivirga jejuensis]MDO5972802.1 methyltransferase [Flavivirga jejuensis]
MNQKLKTSLAFAKNLLVTGAISETSRQVEIDICKHISKEDNKVIVEFGMGHGNITQEILNTIAPTSKLYAFEVKESFCDHVKKNIFDDRLIIVNDGAQNLKKHVKENVNAVISSIPFSFFSKEKGLTIIQDAYSLLENNAYYSQVLYTKFNFKKFQQVFEACEMTSNKNFITEYVYHCRKVRN